MSNASAAAGSPRRWYHSLYWRIALGFIAALALMLVAQGGLLLWLSSVRDEALPPRLLQDVADLVADELATEVERTPGADVRAIARERFAELGRPAALVLPDGTVVADEIVPPEPLVRATAARMREDVARGDDRQWPRGRRARGTRPRGFPRGEGSPGLGPRGGPPWAPALVQVGDRTVGTVLVARGRPFGAVARDLAPWLALGVALLLVAGTTLASVAVFRPAHTRLRDLEDAARRFGAGDLTARAPHQGGDEVAAVARAFNQMAGEAAAREAALVESDRARRQLLADITHELRTPLTAIRGYAETLTLPGFAPTTAQGQHAVHVVDVEAQRLERLVNDLLDLARFDASGAALERSDVSTASLFTRVVERHGPAAAAAGVSLDTHIEGGADTVWGDERRLEQVLQNLTANALRHTPSGGRVQVGAHLESVGPTLETVLRVIDTGQGIPAHHLPHVFDRFYKADASRADSGGTGLGLSIVKAIAERHGGTVRATSIPGVETCFEVRLPAQRTA